MSTQYCTLSDLAFDIFNYLWGFIERSLAQEDFLLQEGPIPLRQTASQTRSETSTCGTADAGRGNTPLSNVSTQPSLERSLNCEGAPENKRVDKALRHNNLPRPASRIFEEPGEQTEYTLPCTPQWLDAAQNSHCHQPLIVLRHLDRQPEQVQMDTGLDVLDPQETPERSSQTSPQHTDTNQNTFTQQQQHMASFHPNGQPDQIQIDGATGGFDPRPYLLSMPTFDGLDQFDPQQSNVVHNPFPPQSHMASFHSNGQPDQIQIDGATGGFDPRPYLLSMPTFDGLDQFDPQQSNVVHNPFPPQSHMASFHSNGQPDQIQIDGATGGFDPRPYLLYMPTFDSPVQFSEQNSDMSLNTSNQPSHLEPTRLTNNLLHTQMSTAQHIINPWLQGSLVESNAPSNDSDTQRHQQSLNLLQEWANHQVGQVGSARITTEVDSFDRLGHFGNNLFRTQSIVTGV